MSTIVYHHNDTDGLTARYLAALVNQDYALCQYNYEDMVPNNELYEILIFIDTTPPVQFLQNEQRQVIIYDHHLNKYQEIMKLNKPNIIFHFDLKRCGSKIYYDHNPQIHNNVLDRIVNTVNIYDLGRSANLVPIYLNEYVRKNLTLVLDYNFLIKEGKKIYESQLSRQLKGSLVSLEPNVSVFIMYEDETHKEQQHQEYNIELNPRLQTTVMDQVRSYIMTKMRPNFLIRINQNDEHTFRVTFFGKNVRLYFHQRLGIVSNGFETKCACVIKKEALALLNDKTAIMESW